MSPDGGAPVVVWPNAVSTANSDPWIAAHHDGLLEMHPRVLVLQFYNGIDPQQTESIALAQIDAIAEGSRYHGYADAGAPAFLQYDLIKVVDLSDHPPPADWQYVSSTRLPTDSSGAFDTNALYTDAFAKNYGFPDPSTPSRYLTLCELFERGSINELWLEVGEEGARAPGLMMESKQVYDDHRPGGARKVRALRRLRVPSGGPLRRERADRALEPRPRARVRPARSLGGIGEHPSGDPVPADERARFHQPRLRYTRGLYQGVPIHGSMEFVMGVAL